MKSKLLKGGLTVIGAVVLSTLGIFASDGLQGIDRNLVGLVGMGTQSVCPEGMVPLGGSRGMLCVDMYEASPGTGCPHQNPSNVVESGENVTQGSCNAASKPKGQPWSFLSLPQAQQVCARSGKRLPSSDEWYRAALGTNSGSCNVNSSGVAEGGTHQCASSIGAYNLVGNVWEWVDETVVDAAIEGRALPEEGYVASVDASGLAITTLGSPQELYDADYFWSNETGIFGMIRGGFYGSKSDAGLYSANASVLTSFASQGVGFRCVKDV